MNRRFHLLALCLLILPEISPAEPPAPPTAKELLDKVVAGRQTTGFTARGRMVITRPSTPDRILQFLVKGRQAAGAKDFLYLALFPAADKGRAVVARKEAGGAITGFIREPDGKTQPLTAARQKQPLFGSDLTIDALTEDFWTWPAPKIIGQAPVCRRDCQIIDTRPPKGSDSDYTFVRLWISPEASLPLRIEMYGADNKLLKRTECRNLVKSGGRYSMEKLTIESPVTGQQTLLDFSKGARDVEIPAADFTAEGIARFLKE